jgi:cellulose synthase/poly-beta-1,6-N-acetylglucosamine synthase-like glycosyltransferase
MQMKHVSIIAPIIRPGDKYSADAISSTKITEAFSHLYFDLRKYGIECEIILVTDSSVSIDLPTIEVYPQVTPVKLHKETGNKSRSELIIKGLSLAKHDTIGVLGSVTDYLPQTFKQVANEIGKEDKIIATVATSPSNILPFLFKMRINPQNGAFFFTRSVWETIKFIPTEDNFLLTFLKRAKAIGMTIEKYQIPSYKVSLFQDEKFSLKKIATTLKDLFLFYLKKIPTIYIPSQQDNSMLNAGLFHKKQKYITHTTLKAYQSALEAFDKQTTSFLILLIGVIVIGLLSNPLLFIQIFIGILSSIYLLDVGFNLFLVGRNFTHSPELSFSKKELARIDEESLPVYSILCPLYKEAHILPQFIKGLEKLDWPKEKLDVIILLESDDVESIKAFDEMQIPKYIRSVVVPNSIPKTKPKACNYGLAFVKGEYTVIYDAEDIPDPQQLKKAYLGFQTSGRDVACIQAKLNYYNADQNLLTRFFTMEYSLWFDITLTSLHSLNTIIPLGGTSNHFRSEDLKMLNAWDPFNVTEDADLGMRLFQLGYRTAILDSVTLEEGNSQVKNWIRQRSRWIKGYMQTYLVHTKKSFSFFQQRGIHALVFHLVIGGKIAFIIINPFLWIVTLLYFGAYAVVGPTIDSFYPPSVLYVAMTSLIFGNYLYLVCHIMGCVKTGQWNLIRYVYLIPLYWVLISVAGFLAFYQLIFKPFYWEKTVHGLHLKKNLVKPQVSLSI